MERNRAALVSDLENSGWRPYEVDDSRVVAYCSGMEGSDNMVDVPDNLEDILRHVKSLKPDNCTVKLFVASPSRLASKLGLDDMVVCEHYGFGDSSNSYSLMLWVVFDESPKSGKSKKKMAKK